jgi:hypothetical protein
MRLRLNWHAVLPMLFAASPAIGQSQADSVVLRVTSPRGTDIAFSGVITLKDGKTERKIENLRTPFELRLPTQNIEARFTAADGGALSGEVIAYRDGKQNGHVTGTKYAGTVELYFQPGHRFGFGPRMDRPLSP